MRLVENMSIELRNIKAIVLDVDGVLTDGRIYFAEGGEQMKVFYVHDGTAIKSWQQQGGKIAFLSGRDSPIVSARARELGVECVIQGCEEKLEPFMKLVADWGIRSEEVCYVGDDTADIPAMQASGYAVAVANAVPEVKKCAKHVTQKSGGCGAVREVIDYLLRRGEPA